MNLDIPAYLFTINKNNSFRLDPEEMKDVEQAVTVSFIGKSINDHLAKKRVKMFYVRAVTKKIRNEELVASEGYLLNSEPGAHEIEVKRKGMIAGLNLNEIQKKILLLLVSGYSYKEIRGFFKMNEPQLKGHIMRIKAQNLSKITKTSVLLRVPR